MHTGRPRAHVSEERKRFCGVVPLTHRRRRRRPCCIGAAAAMLHAHSAPPRRGVLWSRQHPPSPLCLCVRVRERARV